VQYRQFVEVYDRGFKTLFMLEFQHDKDVDWYEVRIYRGADLVGYLHGYANQGWSPQVNNIWVARRFRRKGLGSLMMSKVTDYAGQVPMPATPVEDNHAAHAFWKRFLIQRERLDPEKGTEKTFADWEKEVTYRQFFEVTDKGFATLFVLEFQYDKDTDWFRIRVRRGQELVGYCEGIANVGWHPQVSEIRVTEMFRGKGIASLMVSKIEDYFGFVPMPTMSVEGNEAASGFWNRYIAERVSSKRGQRAGARFVDKEDKDRYRQFLEVHDRGVIINVMLEFQYDRESDWYEVRVFHGREQIAHGNGYANPGWNPQVQNLWVQEKFRRKGIASLMMSEVKNYFGHMPVPTMPMEDNEAAQIFWNKLRARHNNSEGS
jgi:GNAT superfamily N-acetyltransferase